ncbi:MAG: fasciclin domain-containing protein, partial [Bacteroidales bacterium]|nr:fasciclin domain-containing protein [Bacteroidales bacterium]
MLTKKLKYLGILISSVFILYSCQDIQDQEKYQHPEWLVGKLYTQLKSVENTSVFVRALELTGYDTIVDVTGSFTIFAPSDEAFAAYFSDNPEYGSSVENIPPDDLLKLVKYHIIQNAWTKDQIQSADI